MASSFTVMVPRCPNRGNLYTWQVKKRNNTKASVGIIIEFKKGMFSRGSFQLVRSLPRFCASGCHSRNLREAMKRNRKERKQTDSRREKRWKKHQCWGHERTPRKEMSENRDNDLLGMHNQINESNYTYIHVYIYLCPAFNWMHTWDVKMHSNDAGAGSAFYIDVFSPALACLTVNN